MLQLSTFWSHLCALQAASSLPGCRGGHRHHKCLENQNSDNVPTLYNCALKERESLHPTSHRGCNHAKQELQHRRKLWATTEGQHGGHSSCDTQHLFNHSQLLFAAPISGIGSNHHNNNSSRFQEKNTHQDTNQITIKSVHAINVKQP
jgi:hypothetical protein